MSNNKNDLSGLRPNAEAKSKIIEELKENEARKAQATETLNSKLSSFTQSLDIEKVGQLSSLLGTPVVNGEKDGTVYDKPMQGHSTGGGNHDKSAYDKPMQGHSTGGGHHDESAYDKPMQGHSTGGGHNDESAYDKPMQGHSTGGGN